jgi:hypothetical protein
MSSRVGEQRERTQEWSFGHIDQLSIRKALDKREKMKAISEICENCNMRNRYKMGEVANVAAHYLYGKARKFSMI